MYANLTIPEGFHFETGTCPNVGHACNCIGVCRTEMVKDENCKCEGTGRVKRKIDLTSRTWAATIDTDEKGLDTPT